MIGKDQPHHTHQRYRGESDVGRDHHLSALDLVEEPSVQRAEDQREGRCDQDRCQEGKGTCEAKLDGERGAEKSGNNSQRKSEVQSAAGVNHGYYSQYQNTVPAETVNDIGDLCRQICSDKRCHDQQKEQETCDDQTGKAETLKSSLELIFSHLFLPSLK